MKDDVMKKIDQEPEELHTLIEQRPADGLDPSVSAEAYAWLSENSFRPREAKK